MSYLQILSPIVCITINVFVQVFVCRYSSSSSLLRSILVGFATGLLCLFTIEFFIFFHLSISVKDFLFNFACNSIIYSSLGYCYFHFINIGETGRRIRILSELYHSEKGLTYNEIVQRYNSKEIIEKRMNRLINNSQVINRDGIYYIGKPIMLLMTNVMNVAKLIVLSKKKNKNDKIVQIS